MAGGRAPSFFARQGTKNLERSPRRAKERRVCRRKERCLEVSRRVGRGTSHLVRGSSGMKEKRGQVHDGGRAFHQDATEAMRGDIIRALIETITNSDDAYADAHGKIRVEVEHRRGPRRVITRDRAKGMRSARMEEAFVHLGGRTSGFERGENVRGNLGRGAKDLAAFGNVVFESICENRYSKMTLETTGAYCLSPERSAVETDRVGLGIPKGSGTVVTMNVSPNIRCPQHARLTEKLKKHFQLRDILADSRREVQLVDLNDDSSVTLHSAHSALPIVYSDKLTIKEYPEASAVVTICRNPERFDEPASDPYRPGGLLVKGGRAIFENNRHAGCFAARVECVYIDKLASEYDERLEYGLSQDERNPIPIITRRRDGLQENHPFFQSLAAAVEGPLGTLIAEEERKSRESASHEGTRMRRMLDTLGRDLARLGHEDLREIDEDGLGGGRDGDEGVPAIRLIPEQAVLYMGENKTLTVQVRADVGAARVTAEVEPGGVVELVDAEEIPLSPHRRRPGVLSGQVHVQPLLEDAETLLTVKAAGVSAVALIE